MARWQYAKHLVGRFFGHVTAQGLSPREQRVVHDALDGPAAALFWAQSAADQRHALDVANRVRSMLPGDEAAVVAALLHDIGKRHAGLGATARSIATVLDLLGLPQTAAMRRYREHGALGGEELTAAGFDGIVVAFAAHHPGPPPEGVDEGVWDALLSADGGR